MDHEEKYSLIRLTILSDPDYWLNNINRGYLGRDGILSAFDTIYPIRNKREYNRINFYDEMNEEEVTKTLWNVICRQLGKENHKLWKEHKDHYGDLLENASEAWKERILISLIYARGGTKDQDMEKWISLDEKWSPLLRRLRNKSTRTDVEAYRWLNLNKPQ